MSPSDREVRIAGALILAAGLLALGLAILGDELGVGLAVTRGAFGWERGILLASGCVAVPMGILLLIRPQIASRRVNLERAGGYLAIGLLVVLGLALLWTRLIRIDESFWHDEAFTVLNYSGVGPGAILFGEAAFDVNNHVAYNLLSWVTASVLGTSEATYRLWSVFPAIAAVGVATWWAWRRIGAVAAIAFAALMVIAPLHLHLAPQARGYGLALLAATLMLIAADRLTRDYSRRMFVGFLGAGLLGIWTLFIFAIAFVGQALALLRWPHLRRPVVAVVGAAAVLSAAFYAPVLSAVVEARAEGETIPLGAALLLDRSIEWLAVPTGRPVGWWVTLPGLALIVVAIVALWRRGDAGLALLLVLPPLLFNVVFAIAGLDTAQRHQFLLSAHVVLLVAAGIGELGSAVTRYRPVAPIAVGAGALAVLAVSMASVEKVQRNPEPFENHREAAEVAREAELDPIVTDTIRVEGLRYYLGDDLVQLTPPEVESLLCERDQEVVYIRHIPLPPEDLFLWAPADLHCLAQRPAVRIEVPQRREHTSLDVWIVPQPERADGA